jgi:hypothetical protein
MASVARERLVTAPYAIWFFRWQMFRGTPRTGVDDICIDTILLLDEEPNHSKVL